MRNRTIYCTMLMAFLTAISIGKVNGMTVGEVPDTFLIPEKAVILSGNRDAGHVLVAKLYDYSQLHHSDPRAPRFLFLDQMGKVALGIGGYVKGTLQYDMDGSIDDGANFITYDIPVPMDPALRNQYYANANNSTIYLKLVGKSEKFGYYQAYIQTNFSGDGVTGYGLKLKQVYLSVGSVTAGLARSSFVDGSAGVQTVEDEGPTGEIDAKNIILQYRTDFNKHFSGAISVEMPNAQYSENTDVKAIKQRVPDIPAYIQYAWQNDSHIRLSGLLRNLSYRDLVAQDNRFATCWAVQLSGVINLGWGTTFLYEGATGCGYAHYVNDLSGTGFDLIPDGISGKMKAPQIMNLEVGFKKYLRPHLFVSALYSQARVYGQQSLGPDAYRYAQYASVNCFYDIVSDLRIGVGYIYGNRANMNGMHGHANRAEGMLQFNF